MLLYFIIICSLLLLCIAAYSMFHRFSVKKTLATQLISLEGNTLNIDFLSCTCKEWRNERMRFKQADPRRLCIHLCNYFADNINIIPGQLKLFTKTITLMHNQSIGIPHKTPAFVFVLGTKGYIATTSENKYPIITVYTEDNIYYYNIKDSIWQNEVPTDFSEEIGNLIKAEIGLRLQKEKTKKLQKQQK